MLGPVALLPDLFARDTHKNDKAAQVTHRRCKATKKYNAQVQKQARTAASRDKAEQTATNSLCTDLLDLELQLKARKNNKDSRLTFLKDQVYARIAGEHPRLYPGLGQQWRKKGGKIRLSSPLKDQSDEDYLGKLVAANYYKGRQPNLWNKREQYKFSSPRLHQGLTFYRGGIHQP